MTDGITEVLAMERQGNRVQWVQGEPRGNKLGVTGHRLQPRNGHGRCLISQSCGTKSTLLVFLFFLREFHIAQADLKFDIYQG